jgi:hypothetical protein
VANFFKFIQKLKPFQNATGKKPNKHSAIPVPHDTRHIPLRRLQNIRCSATYNSQVCYKLLYHTANKTGPDIHYLAQITEMVTANVLPSTHMLAATNYLKVHSHNKCAILQQINEKMAFTKLEYEHQLTSVHHFLTTNRKYTRRNLKLRGLTSIVTVSNNNSW